MSSKNQEQNPNKQKNNETLSSVLVIVAIVLTVALIAGYSYYMPVVEDIIESFKSYDKYIEKGNHIDENAGIVTLTYPSSIFTDDEERKTSVETLESADGTKEVVENPDGSLTVVMTKERYDKILEAAMYAAESVPYFTMSETSAIKDFAYDATYTQIDVTVDTFSETLNEECGDIISILRLYHVCNMKTEIELTLNYIDVMTGETYLSEVYDINGNLISSLVMYE